MNALIILIPVTLVLIGFATVLFFWGVRHDQFQDLDTPEILPLIDDLSEPETPSLPTTEKHA